MKNELKKYRKKLNSDFQPCSEGGEEEGDDDQEQVRSTSQAFLEIAQNFLRRMKQAELAECLQSGKNVGHVPEHTSRAKR